jgi:hypothetical protein
MKIEQIPSLTLKKVLLLFVAVQEEYLAVLLFVMLFVLLCDFTK